MSSKENFIRMIKSLKANKRYYVPFEQAKEQLNKEKESYQEAKVSKTKI